MKTYYVCHGLYGCETGCCGYRLCLDDEGDTHVGEFEFFYPQDGESAEDFARRTWPNIVNPDDAIREGKWFTC